MSIDRLCRYGHCLRKVAEHHFYCDEHPNGKEKPMIENVPPMYVLSEGLTLDEYLFEALSCIRLRMREMGIRRDLSPAEQLGHFCTELRRQLYHVTRQNSAITYKIYEWSDTRYWTEPFRIMPHAYSLRDGQKVLFNGKEEHMTLPRMQTICDRAVSTTEEGATIESTLSTLSRQVAFFDTKTLETHRLTRSATDLLTETNLAVAHFHGD